MTKRDNGIYSRIVDKNLFIRRINLTANHVVYEASIKKTENFEQLNLFTDYGIEHKKKEEEEVTLELEKKMQHAVIDIKKKYGKNAILKGINLKEGATARERNKQIGGHKA